MPAGFKEAWEHALGWGSPSRVEDDHIAELVGPTLWSRGRDRQYKRRAREEEAPGNDFGELRCCFWLGGNNPRAFVLLTLCLFESAR